MKTWKYISTVAVIGTVMLGSSVYGQDTTTTTTPSGTTTTVIQNEPPPSTVVVSNYTEPFYRDHELSIDGFGTLSLGEQFINNISTTKIRKNGRLGAGAGVN